MVAWNSVSKAAIINLTKHVATAFGKIGATDANARWSEWFEDIIVALTDEQGELYTAQEVWHLD